MELEHHLTGMVIRKCVLLNFANKDIICVGYASIVVLEVKIRQTLLSSVHWICIMARLMYPILILNTILTNIFFPHDKIIGMVRSRTSFILSSRCWEVGSPPTGGAGRINCLVSCPHRSYLSNPYIHLEERSSTSV